MAAERDLLRMMRQAIHKKQERTQTIQSEEPRINDLKEGIPEFRNVRDRGIVQYIKYRDEIYSIVMKKEGLTDGRDEGTSDSSGRIDGSLTASIGTAGTCSNTTYKTQEGCEVAGETWTASSAIDGWQTLTGGLIIQWGVTTGSGLTEVVTFPKAFNGECFQVVAQAGKDPGGGTANTNCYDITNTTFEIYHGSGERPARWIALGY